MSFYFVFFFSLAKIFGNFTVSAVILARLPLSAKENGGENVGRSRSHAAGNGFGFFPSVSKVGAKLFKPLPSLL